MSNGIGGRYLAMGMIKDGNTSECRDKAMAFDLCWLENKVTIFIFFLKQGDPGQNLHRGVLCSHYFFLFIFNSWPHCT